MRFSISAEMHRIFSPETAAEGLTAFFTGKIPGADIDSISRMLSIHRENIYLPIQKHTDKVIVLDSSREPKVGDAVITRECGILIGVQTADCVPILFHERRRDVIGAVHAGWRGTAAGILKNSLSRVFDRYSGDPDDMRIYIGPAIGKCCYSVDYDVFHAVRTATGEGEYFREELQGKYFIDLQAANRYQAMLLGVPGRNIEVLSYCTRCNPEQFFSYRYAKGSTGRQGGFIGKRPASADRRITIFGKFKGLV